MERLDFYSVCANIGLPNEIGKSYENIGLHQLYKWQYECLFNTNILLKKNLIYCAPTSGGKTLVAELLILKTILNPINKKQKAIFVVPYISLVSEKEKHVKRILTLYNRAQLKSDRIRVKGYYGEQTVSRHGIKESVLICTIEKVNIIINSLILSGQIHTLGVIVIDELHVLGDPHRGYLLEILVGYI